MKRRRLLSLAIPILLASLYGGSQALADSGTGVGNVPQGRQSDDTYSGSFDAKNVTNVVATAHGPYLRPAAPARLTADARVMSDSSSRDLRRMWLGKQAARRLL